MSRFAALLDETRRALDLPHPVKAEILDELAADLEALYEHYLAAGDDELSALRKAHERLVAAPDALAELVELHRPFYMRIVRRFSDRTRGRVERAVLTVVVLGLLATGAVGLGPRRILDMPAHFTVPFLTVAAGIVAILVAKAFQLVVRRDDRPDRIRAGLFLLAVLSAAAPAVGLLCAAIELYALAGGAAGGSAQAAVWGSIGRAATQLAAGLVAGIAGAAGCFALGVRAARIAAAERAYTRRP